MADEEDRACLVTRELTPVDFERAAQEDDGDGIERGQGASGTSHSEEGRDEGCVEGGCYRRNNPAPLSVQSGDIVLPATPSQPHVVSHGKVYTKLFPIVHKAVKVVFYSEKVPIIPIVILALLLMVMAGMILLIVFVFPPSFNINIQSVQVPNHASTKHWDAYQAALAGQYYNDSIPTDNSASGKDYSGSLFDGGNELKGKSDSKSIDCCSSYYRHQRVMQGAWILELVYRVREGQPNNNVLENDRIEYLHEFEEYIYDLPQYKTVCHFKDHNEVCDPINSILTYLYQRNDDGSAKDEELSPNWKADFDPSQLKVSQLEHLLWYTGGQIGENYSTPLLRAQVRIGVPLPCYCSVRDRKEEQHQKATDFFVSLIPYLDGASNNEIEILYGGVEIFDYEVNQAKLHDILLGIASAVIILIMMIILTGFSLSLTIWAAVAIVMCWVVAAFVYRVFLQYETFSLLSVATTFVIIGIGVDDVFVFLNTFKQSKYLEGLDTVHQRLTHTILVATSATFLTSATTTIAFLANAVSQIPAIHQFAVFTGLVVFFCFVTVATTMPLFLHIWECCFLPLENCTPCIWLWRRSKTPASYSSLPPVRMTELMTADVDNDSGILEDRGSDSVGSDSNSMGSDSHSSTSSLLDGEEDTKKTSEMDTSTNGEVPGMIELQNGNGTTTVTVSRTRTKLTTLEDTITTFVQRVSLHFVARVVMYPQMVQYTCIPDKNLRAILQWSTRLLPVVLFVAILAGMTVAMTKLRPSDHQPQFFDPDSNIQKMLDLEANLTQRVSVNCWDCSAWYSDGGGSSTGGGGGGDTTTEPSSTPHTTTPPPTDPPTDDTTTSSSSSTPSSSPSSSTSEPTDSTTSPTSTTTSSTQTSSSSSSSPTSTSSTSSSSSGSTPTSPTTASPLPPQSDPNLSNNVIVYVVFGLNGVHREYSASHVLPNEGEGTQAILNPAFFSNFSQSSSSLSRPAISTLRAMCRICRNISKSDLVLKNAFTCFPSPLVNTFKSSLASSGNTLRNFEDECRGLLRGNSHIDAKGGTIKENGQESLAFLAMAFRSTTNSGNSSTRNIEDYRKWEDLLSSELEAIKSLSGPGDLYEGANDLIAPTFQTSDYWVQINTEIIAIRGSFFGILISIVLCAVVVAFLSNNGPVIIAMGLTILAILVTLLGLFKLFGWTLGIIEAVSLSILVGNSLDYCIHLSEGYVATDHRHLAFLSQFKFTHSASTRVKRVLSAISFIGVSILSSALTTIFATFPLLFAKILLFTRFATILMLDTTVAIIYTLFFCATFLSLFGPRGNSCNVWRVVNGVTTIIGTSVLMAIIFVVAMVIMSHNNII